ncbi:MAG TPA: hypothetical protein DD490_28340, partial [Acidobacteria bacterium]|nr:hypothetical protein [Acidobacteriota bacterium]
VSLRRVAPWTREGLSPVSAHALVRAGWFRIEDLAPVSREEFLARPGLGLGALERCETLLGRPLVSSLQFWMEGGLPQRTARLLSRARIHSLEQLERHAPEALHDLGLGLPEVAALAGLMRRVALGGGAGGDAEVLFWCRQGVPPAKAQILAGFARDEIAAMSREDLLEVPGIGPHTLRLCEKALGRKFPKREESNPAWAYWRRLGVSGPALAALVARGLRSVEDLRRLDRREIRRLPGCGTRTLRRIEALLGTALSSAGSWKALGLPGRLANGLDRAGIDTLEELAKVTREELLAQGGLDRGSLERCEALLGRRLPSAVKDWRARGLPQRLAWTLSRRRVLTVEDLRRLTGADLLRFGFDREEAELLLDLARGAHPEEARPAPFTGRRPGAAAARSR